MKRIAFLLALVLLTVSLLAACDKGSEAETESDTESETESVVDTDSETETETETVTVTGIDMSPVDISKAKVTENATDYVILSVENFGDILIRLYPDIAPRTVANFKKLVSEKFYDGLTFHRIIKDFMIQGGDPEGTGFGGSDETIPGEFYANGIPNDLPHVRGVLSMARSQHPDSASSQFFIVHKTERCTHLNGYYAAFGYVVDGMDVVDKIASVDVWPEDNSPRFTTVKISGIRFAEIEE